MADERRRLTLWMTSASAAACTSEPTVKRDDTDVPPKDERCDQWSVSLGDMGK